MTTPSERARPVILVAEDDTTIRDMLELLLLGEGYDVVPAADGQDALDGAARHRIDLILLDLAMPKLDGEGFCRAYRERGGTAPIVLITAVVGEKATEAIDVCGADGHIAKPFNIEDVLVTVARLVEPRRGG